VGESPVARLRKNRARGVKELRSSPDVPFRSRQRRLKVLYSALVLTIILTGAGYLVVEQPSWSIRLLTMAGLVEDPMVQEESDKPTVIALREIAEGLIDKSVLTEEVVPQEDIEAMIEGELQESAMPMANAPLGDDQS